MTKAEALKTYFGYDAFREGQERVVDTLLSGQDALAVMPTGAGKSVCYQIPALLLPGITLVISPLVSLMADQVTALVQMGIPAAYLNSTLTYRQYLLALERARAGRYKLIYVAPERLENEGFLDFVRHADISLVAWTRPTASPSGDRTFGRPICASPLLWIRCRIGRRWGPSPPPPRPMSAGTSAVCWS